MSTVINWPLVWIALGGGAALGAILQAALPHRADERPRSDSEQQ